MTITIGTWCIPLILTIALGVWMKAISTDGWLGGVFEFAFFLIGTLGFWLLWAVLRLCGFA